MRPFRLGLLLLALASAGCHAEPPPDHTLLLLKTYEAPKGAARSLLLAIKDALWIEDKKVVGRATMTPDGRIAVLAPSSVQVGIAKLVEGVSEHPPLEQTIELHYYVMFGKPVSAAAPMPRGVAEIQPALDEIARSQGPQEFTVAKRVTLASLNDEQGRLDGEDLEIRQQCVETTDGVYANVTMRYGKQDKLETRVHLAPDRIVVLGATGQHGDAADSPTLYYVIRVAPRADGHHP